jgi:hypothetical protein
MGQRKPYLPARIAGTGTSVRTSVFQLLPGCALDQDRKKRLDLGAHNAFGHQSERMAYVIFGDLAESSVVIH